MAKRAIVILSLAFALAVTALWTAADAHGTQRDLAEKLIRLHVVANSDSEADQALKYRVRDAVLARAEEVLAGCGGVEAAEEVLTDSLPAIAIGVEPATGNLLNRPPRDPKEPILNGNLMGSIMSYGVLIALATMGAYFVGLNGGGAARAMTLAFATLTLARLFHGINCRGEGSVFKLGLLTNKASVGAFFAGVALLAAAMFIPGVTRLFQISSFTGMDILAVVLLAVAPTVLIQIFKVIRDAIKK